MGSLFLPPARHTHRAIVARLGRAAPGYDPGGGCLRRSAGDDWSIGAGVTTLPYVPVVTDVAVRSYLKHESGCTHTNRAGRQDKGDDCCQALRVRQQPVQAAARR